MRLHSRRILACVPTQLRMVLLYGELNLLFTQLSTHTHRHVYCFVVSGTRFVTRPPGEGVPVLCPASPRRIRLLYSFISYSRDAHNTERKQGTPALRRCQNQAHMKSAVEVPCEAASKTLLRGAETGVANCALTPTRRCNHNRSHGICRQRREEKRGRRTSYYNTSPTSYHSRCRAKRKLVGGSHTTHRRARLRGPMRDLPYDPRPPPSPSRAVLVTARRGT